MGSRGASSGRKGGGGGGAALSDINGGVRQTFDAAHMSDAYKAIAATDLQSRTYVNVTYSTGRVISFHVGKDPRSGESALIRQNVNNPLATRSLKFKSQVTLKNKIVDEGKRGKDGAKDATPIKIVINPNKAELDFNRT